MKICPSITVVICTRNPRTEVFARVLDALTGQTLNTPRWELVIIDNGSTPAVSLPVLPAELRCRMVIEPTAGLTPARIRGIHEASGDLLIFVDDDNILAADYLETALWIASEFPQVGAFGGRVLPEFEQEPPAWLQPFLSRLALADFARDAWSNLPGDRGLTPCGAGLCIRRQLSEKWADEVTADPRRLALGRRADDAASAEDADMVYTCIAEGWGAGRFTALCLTHVIPAARLDFDYQRRLARGIGWSYGRLLAIRGWATIDRRLLAWAKVVQGFLGLKHRGRSRTLDLDYHRAFLRGLASSR
jgi:glycosyltransferase involved in cell wall biosynthesis